MNEADRAHLRSGARALGVELSDEQENKLVRYVALLLAWNDKVNLTAVTEPRAIVDKHLLDSLAVVPFLEQGRVIDVGTGPGLPSIVLAIARPDLLVTAVESIFKKATFVRAAARDLRLSVTVEPVRLEALVVRAPFDLAISRATFDPGEWVERGAPLVRTGGCLVAMLSAQQNLPEAPPGFSRERMTEHTIGGAVRRIVSYRRDSGG